MAVITGSTVHEASSARTQKMNLPSIVRSRRLTFLGHLLRLEEGDLTRQAVLRFAELLLREVLQVEGSILMDAPAYNSVAQLVWMAGGSGTTQEREDNRKQWRKWAFALLGPADQARKKKKQSSTGDPSKQVRANTAAETAEKLAQTDHSLRIYTDGGSDGNGAKGQWGESGWGVAVFQVTEEGNVFEIADLYGPVVATDTSPWFAGAARGTNQTGEVTGIMQALLYLLHGLTSDTLPARIKEGGVVICVDSLYAINMAEGHWDPKANEDLIKRTQDALARVREQRQVVLVHVKGHSDDPGNDRADDLVQWGKTSGPYTRYQQNGTGEGDGRFVHLRGYLRKVAKPDPGDEGDEDPASVRPVLVLGKSQPTESENEESGGESSGDSAAGELAALLDFDEEDSFEEQPAPEEPEAQAEETDSEISGSILRALLESTRSGMETAGDGSELNEKSADEQYAMGSRGSHEPSDSGRGGNLKSRGLIDNT